MIELGLNQGLLNREDLLVRIEKSLKSVRDENLKIEGKFKLIKFLEAEKLFLNKKLYYNEKDLKSTNYHYLGDLQVCLTLFPNIYAILRSFKTENDSRVRVDIVAEEGLKWLKVVSKHTKALYSMLDGVCGSGKKSLKEQIKELKKVAEYNKCNFQVPKIVFVFFHDIPSQLLNEINCLNIEINQVVKSEIKVLCHSIPHFHESLEKVSTYGEVFEEKLEGLCPSKECVCKDYLKRAVCLYQQHPTEVLAVNLDVSSMIALVSNQCHGRNSFKFADEYLSQQAEKEKSESALFYIFKFLVGKNLHVCKTAINSFLTIIDTIAGDNEKERASRLISMLIQEDDQTSEKAQKLPLTSKISERSITIFGTGDSLRAVTCTSNAAFLRAARQTGTEFVVFTHQARSLSEQKEATAYLL